MSDSRKRLVVRVAIVTVAVALVILALVAIPGGADDAEPKDSAESTTASVESPSGDGPVAAAESAEYADESDPYGLAQLASWQSDVSQPSGQSPNQSGVAVVRGNHNGQFAASDGRPTPPTPPSFGGSTGMPTQPPSQSSFDSQFSNQSAQAEIRQPPPGSSSFSGPSVYGAAAGAAVGAAAGAASARLSDDSPAPMQQSATPPGNSASGSSTYGAPTPASPGSNPNDQFGSTPQSFSMPTQSSPVPTPAARPVPGGGSSSFDSSANSGNLSNMGASSALSEISSAPLYNVPGSGHTSPTPGPKQLDGVQSPSLVLEKRAPPEIQVGKAATFEIRVQNVGNVDAHDVIVIDQIPQGTVYESATPQPERATDGSLHWNLGTIEPGNSKLVSVQLIPSTEGEIGSVATVSFQTQASVRTRCTKPELKLEHSGPAQVLIGQNVTFDITVTNTGTGVATGVVLEEDVPEQLAHPAGGELEFEIGTLRPGESRQLKLTLEAANAGAFEHELVARADGNLLAPDRIPLEVTAPELDLQLSGPSVKYLERQAKFALTVRNPGSAPATNVELVSYLPKGLKFVSTNNHGQYDPQSHAVYWSLAQLPAQETGSVELVLLPQEMGEQKVRVESRADLGLSKEGEKTVFVDGLAALVFGVADSSDPIEVGSETSYQIQVTNQGSKSAEDVQVRAVLPIGMEPVGGDGPTTYQISGQTIQFLPLTRLAPKEQVTFNVKVRGIQPGDHRVNVVVSTREIPSPVSKEESTRVYVDR